MKAWSISPFSVMLTGSDTNALLWLGMKLFLAAYLRSENCFLVALSGDPTNSFCTIFIAAKYAPTLSIIDTSPVCIRAHVIACLYILSNISSGVEYINLKLKWTEKLLQVHVQCGTTNELRTVWRPVIRFVGLMPLEAREIHRCPTGW